MREEPKGKALSIGGGPMKRFSIALGTALGALLLASVPASAQFGFRALDLSISGVQAGAHPAEVVTTVDMETVSDELAGREYPDGQLRDLEIDMPEGFAGNPNAVPQCSFELFTTVANFMTSCPNSTAVGYAAVKADFDPIELNAPAYLHLPVYNLPPDPGYPAKLGFAVRGVPVTVAVGLRESPPYNVFARITDTSQAALFYASKVTLWGNPASPSHDPYRGNCLDVNSTGEVDQVISKGKCAANTPERPFLTSTRSCDAPGQATFVGLPWNSPIPATGSVGVPARQGCSQVGFEAAARAELTSTAAESPSGLSFNLDIEDEGLVDPSEEAIAASDIKQSRVILPDGITVNPSQATGLQACSEAQLAAETAKSSFGGGCPAASTIGGVEVETPLLEGRVIKGSIFLAQPYENPFGTLLALYMVIKDRGLGVSVKLPAKVETDPVTGQITTTFGDPSASLPGYRSLPQLPLGSVRVSLQGGERSPLVTPPACGSYETRAVFTPWANPDSPLVSTSSFQINRGPDGGPCPSGLPFSPSFEGGTLNNNAGSHSPMLMRLTRRDGDQDLTKFAASLPPGLVGKLAGLQQCSDAALAVAKARTGREEKAAPSCPASSRIGGVLAGAGVGQALTYVPGSLYLAGSYNGAPLSVAAIVPAVAGPFDVGTVVTRVALRIDPRSAKVTVDGSASDPIPHILAGIPLKVRDIRVDADRPDFTLNPTSCEPSEFAAQIFGGGADVFSTADDSPVARSERFQAANCASLPFKPTLNLRLKGGTKRGDHPALRGEYRPRPGDANLKGLALRLPPSAFLEQAHIRTICTRPQFAAKACPKGAVYGYARAWTPLLEQPLEGPVYLRANGGERLLPDVVADLHGLIDVEAVATIDSKNAGIRATFTDVPDAPLTKVVVSMRGGKKGLIVNSRNLCAATNRAGMRFVGQNGKSLKSRPVVRPDCGSSSGVRKGR